MEYKKYKVLYEISNTKELDNSWVCGDLLTYDIKQDKFIKVASGVDKLNLADQHLLFKSFCSHDEDYVRFVYPTESFTSFIEKMYKKAPFFVSESIEVLEHITKNCKDNISNLITPELSYLFFNKKNNALLETISAISGYDLSKNEAELLKQKSLWLIENGINVHYVDEASGQNAMHQVCKIQYPLPEVAQALIDKGIDCNLYNKGSNTPIMGINANIFNEIFPILVKAGADLNAKDCFSDTLLHYLSNEEDGISMVDYILKNHWDDVDAEAQNRTGRVFYESQQETKQVYEYYKLKNAVKNIDKSNKKLKV